MRPRNIRNLVQNCSTLLSRRPNFTNAVKKTPQNPAKTSLKMAENRQLSAINVGGKGSSLTSSSIFSIANNLVHIRIDSSLLDKLSSSTTTTTNSTIKYRIAFPETLTLEESRASLIVLLVKLLHSNSSIRAEIPNLITKTLNSCEERLDIDDFDVSEVEKGVLDDCSSIAPLDGVCALLDHGISSLSPVAEAIAALSCEAVKAKVSAFNLVDSGDGKCLKDDAGVASDLKVLLNGSKSTGKVEIEAVSSVPEVFGSLREVVRAVHSRARVGLNSGVTGLGKAWGATLSSLATALRNVGEGSLSRVGLNIDSVVNEGIKSNLKRLVDEKCPGNTTLKEGFKGVLDAGFEEEYVNLVHNVYTLFCLVRRVVLWELVTAFVSLEGSDLLVKKQEGAANVGDAKVDKKSDKRKKVLGKGTAVVLQLIKDQLSGGYGEVADEFVAVEKLADEIQLLLDPKVPAFGDFVEKIKEIVESNESRRLPKLAKGTRDFAKEQMAVRERAFSIITEVFKRHGAMALDTPVFELRETLMGKYGEDSKLIYDLADQGGELCSLRYDLTVPFARFVAMNRLTSFKRYQIAKVYRRDNPSKGRYREFYQCDFDIAGQFDKMGPDFEVIKILTELLDELNIGTYEVKLNHRKLLDGMLEICGVPPEKFRTICSSIDKLDKQSFDQVKKEMVEEKGLTAEIADRIGGFVKDRGSPLELLAKLRQEGSEFLSHEGSAQALNELEILFNALERANGISNIVFDLSLARGLDYYTGVIYEAVFKGTTQVGSIAAGGRYDNLIGMFGSTQVPAVGVSLGIERVFAIMEQNQKDQNQVIRASETQVLVGVMGDDLCLAAELAGELWSAKIKAEYVLAGRKITKIFDRADASGIPFAVMVGDREVNAGIVKVRNMQTRQEDSIPRDKMVEELLSRLRN